MGAMLTWCEILKSLVRAKSTIMTRTDKSGPLDKQTVNRRPDGKFAKGNILGNRFQPGRSGNPQDRPKYRTLSEAFRQYLAEVDPNDEQGRTRAEVTAERLYNLAKINHPSAVSAFKELADRSEGRPPQAPEIDVPKMAAERLAALLGISVEQLPDARC